MIIGENNERPNAVHDLDDEKEVVAYIQGMVYGWCQSRNTDTFAGRDLFGGVNWNWNDTPLQQVYDKQKTDGETAYNVAAQEAGRLLKLVIYEDKRKFTCERRDDAYYYTWDGNYPEKD